MAKKKQKKQKPAPQRPAAAGAPQAADAVTDGLAEARIRVQALIESGKQKAALDAAKAHAKAAPCGGAEALLLDAYVARIEGMLAKNMAGEALALMDIVEARFPAARERLVAFRNQGAARGGKLDSLVAPLADSNLPRPQREEIETALAVELTDLDALAKCGALPADHPLRTAAAAVRDAFAKVTAGPVPDGEIALPEVSHRSPLAPWKLLIRAIALFYRHEDAACLECIARLPEHSAPARLAPLFEVLCEKRPAKELWPEARKAATGIRGDDSALRKALDRCDAIFVDFEFRDPMPPIRSAVNHCERLRPDLADRLKQRLSVYLLGEFAERDVLKDIFGFATPKDAHFWRLVALRGELAGDAPFARSAWEEFRMHAIHEGWFAEGSAIEAALLLYMASIEEYDDNDGGYDPFYDDEDDEDDGGSGFRERDTMPFDEADMQRYYAGQDTDVRAARDRMRKASPAIHQDSGALFARACEIDPRVENFKRWRQWACANAGDRTAEDEPLLRWAAALPRDPEPLVWLAEAAERRKALTKALGYLDRAEARNALDPRVRRARFRLNMSAAIRHIKAGKAHLLRKDLADIEALDGARDGNRPALLAVLSWAAACMEANGSEIEACSERLAALAGGPVGAHLLAAGAAAHAGKLNRWPVPAIPKDAYRDGRGWIASAARALRAVSEGDLMYAVPRSDEEWLVMALRQEEPNAAGDDLLVLARVALEYKKMQLAYDAAGAGLRLQGPHDARFLLVRAQTLPSYSSYRRYYCLAAARRLVLHIADHALAEEIMSAFHGGEHGRFGSMRDAYDREEALALNDMGAREVLRCERALIAENTRQDLPRGAYNKLIGSGRWKMFDGQYDSEGHGFDGEPDECGSKGASDKRGASDKERGKANFDKRVQSPEAAALLDEILDFIEARTGARMRPRGQKQFEEYCAAVPHLNGQWEDLKARFEKLFGTPFHFSALP